MRTTTFLALLLLAPAAAAQEAEPAASFLHQLVGDFDGDGAPDLYCFGPGREDALFHNDGSARFAEATGEAGLAGLRSRTALLADLDGDGREDLLLVGQDGVLRLLRNGGAGLFEDVSGASGLDVLPPITAASSLHLDDDGRLDLRLEGERGEPVLLHNQGQAGFAVLRLELPVADVAAVAPPSTSALPGSDPDRSMSGGLVVEAPGDRTVPAPAPGPGSRRPVAVTRTEEQATTFSPAGPTGPQQAAPRFCAPAIADLSGGCLEASSTPVQGMLFPLSADYDFTPIGVPINPSLRLDLQSQLQQNGVGYQYTVRGVGAANPPVLGDLAVLGTINHAGVASADWGAYDIGVAGIATGPLGPTGNYGVMGHSNNVGVRGEHASAPTTDYAELGTAGTGLIASGSSRAARMFGNLSVHDGTGLEPIFIEPEDGSGARISMKNSGTFTTIQLDSHYNTGDPRLRLYNETGGQRFDLTLASDGAEMTMNAADGSSALFFDGTGGNGGGAIAVRNDTGQSTVILRGDDGGDDGKIEVIDRGSSSSIELDGDDSDFLSAGAAIRLRDLTADATVYIASEGGGTGNFIISEEDGSKAFQMQGPSLNLFDANGTATLVFNRITGAKNGVVNTQSYGQRLLYAVESPEVWFEDFGSARLANGEVTIELDPIFLETVTIDDAHPMLVYLTPTSPGLPLWVENGQRSFTVRAMPGGRGDGSFSWRVVAKRKGLEDARLEPFEDAP